MPRPAAPQQQVLERPLDVVAIPQAPSEAYQPCGTSNFGPSALCLADRIRELERIGGGQFEGENGSCRLIYPNEPVEHFACGKVLVGLRPNIDAEAREAIREAAGGDWSPIYSAPGVIAARLRIAPGTERAALRNIIFHPMVMWAEFNHSNAVALCN